MNDGRALGPMPEPEAAIWTGVDQLLENYVGIMPNDIAVVLYTPDSWQPAIWVSCGLQFQGIKVERVCMKRLSDDEFPARLKAVLPAPENLSGRLILIALERDTMSHAEVIGRELNRYAPERRASFRLISASADLFSKALHVTPEELTRRNAQVLNFLSGAKSIRITTAGGTDLTAKFDSQRFRWISNRGIARTGRNVILPAGEVATYPAHVSGTLVADFAFNINAITERDARLSAYPVTVKIVDSEAVEVSCGDRDVLRFVAECFKQPNARRVGEMGFGTNPCIVDPIPLNSHVNERRSGVHLGFGQHNQTLKNVDYQCKVHLDLIARGGRIVADGERVLDLEALSSTTNEIHPDFPDDEDVFAPDASLEEDDCCGILTSDGLKPLFC